MRKLIFLLLTSAGFMQGSAQLKETDNVKKAFETKNEDTVAWERGGLINIGVNEGFLHNWAAGGEIASLAVSGMANCFLIRYNHDKIWSTSADLNYGLLYTYSTGFVPQKTDDRIDVTSKYEIKLDSGRHFYLTGLFNFKSQFTKGYNYLLPAWDSAPTSKFMSPAYFTLGAGIEYRRGADLTVFLSPAAARLTVADAYFTKMQPEGAFGIPYGKSSQFAFGAYMSARYVVAFSKNISFKTRLDLFANYLAKDQKDSTGAVVKKDNPGNIDILWDNLLIVNVGRYLALTAGLTMIYDNDIPYQGLPATPGTTSQTDPGKGLGWWQMKETFTLGFKYKF